MENSRNLPIRFWNGSDFTVIHRDLTNHLRKTCDNIPSICRLRRPFRVFGLILCGILLHKLTWNYRMPYCVCCACACLFIRYTPLLNFISRHNHLGSSNSERKKMRWLILCFGKPKKKPGTKKAHMVNKVWKQNGKTPKKMTDHQDTRTAEINRRSCGHLNPWENSISTGGEAAAIQTLSTLTSKPDGVCVWYGHLKYWRLDSQVCEKVNVSQGVFHSHSFKQFLVSF